MVRLRNDNIKEKIPYLFTGLALFICMVLSGGLNWNGCICSLTLMIVSIVLLNGFKKIRVALLIILMIVFCGISAFISMGNPQVGIYETYKFLCFVTALMVGYLFKSDKKIFKIIFFNALILSAFGILACCKIVNFDEFTFKDNSILRLQSFVKYANVTACFLGCGYISFLELFVSEKKSAYLYGGSCILIAMYFTFSKACLPIFLIVATLYLHKKKHLSKIFLMQNIIAIFLLSIMLFVSVRNIHFLLLILTVAGIIISGKISISDNKFYKIWLLTLIAFFVAAVSIVLFKPSMLGTFSERLKYMKDAINLVWRNPLFGCGFGSWRVLQYTVQTKQYNVTYMHNGVLQMIVENGILFTVCFLGMIVYGVICGIKHKKHGNIAIVLTILIHSLVDCDLSFGVILIILGLIVGGMFPEKSDFKIYNCISNCLLVVLLSVSCIYMFTEYTMRSSFEKSYLESHYDIAKTKLNRLSMICPFDFQLKVTEAALEEKTTNDMVIIKQKLKESVELLPYDPEIYEMYMNYNLTDGNIKKMCMEYVNIAPKQEKTYAFLKQYLSKAKKNKIISEEEYLKIFTLIENKRINERVIDRNELLDQITEKER